MICIIPHITSLRQHMETLKTKIAHYRPPCCLRCACKTLWCHGYYYRKTSRDSRLDDADNPIPIPRFICKNCRCTFSCLPECIPPRRWYSWAVQEDVFKRLFNALNFKRVAELVMPGRSTLRRWWHSLKSKHLEYADHIKNQWPELGRRVSFGDFWQTCLNTYSLACVMRYLYDVGARAPP